MIITNKIVEFSTILLPQIELSEQVKYLTKSYENTKLKNELLEKRFEEVEEMYLQEVTALKQVYMWFTFKCPFCR